MENSQNLQEALSLYNIMTYQFVANVGLRSYLSKEYLSLSKAEERSVACFDQLFTEYKMAVLEICPELISETVAQLAKEIEKKELAGEQSDDSNKFDACSKFAENFRMYRFISTSSISDYFLRYTFDKSKKEKRRIIQMHQTWTDCMVDEVETHHELFIKAFDQLVKEIKKKEKAAKVPQDLTESQPDSEFEELN
jgi:hypothetical protein